MSCYTHTHTHTMHTNTHNAHKHTQCTQAHTHTQTHTMHTHTHRDAHNARTQVAQTRATCSRHQRGSFGPAGDRCAAAGRVEHLRPAGTSRCRDMSFCCTTPVPLVGVSIGMEKGGVSKMTELSSMGRLDGYAEGVKVIVRRDLLVTGAQPSARVRSFCWRPLSTRGETPAKGRGGCSRMAV